VVSSSYLEVNNIFRIVEAPTTANAKLRQSNLIIELNTRGEPLAGTWFEGTYEPLAGTWFEGT
jgi:hypothetical protein